MPRGIEDPVDEFMAEVERDASPQRFDSDDTTVNNPTILQEIGAHYEGTALERHPTALQRVHTHRNQHRATVGSTLQSSTLTKPLPPFGAGKPYPPPLPERERYVVEFDGPDDPLHGQNWPMKKKLCVGAVLGWDTLVAAFGSSIFSAATTHVAPYFHVSIEVATLGMSMYLLGFASGPIVWAPISELYGRRLPLLISGLGLGVFFIGCAVGKDLQTVLICRFFAGFMGASPLTIVPAIFSDLFNNRHRGIAITIFAMTVFTGKFNEVSETEQS